MPQSYIYCVIYLLLSVAVFPPVLMTHWESDEILSSINKSWYYCSAAQPDGRVERERDAKWPKGRATLWQSTNVETA